MGRAAEPNRILTHQDRCDWPRCNARAYGRAFFNFLTEEQETAYLNLCMHHFNDAPTSMWEQTVGEPLDETWDVRQLFRRVSVTRRYVRFLFERDETVNARKGDPQELVRYLDETRWRIDEAEGDWQLAPTDDDRVGDD